MTPEQTQDESQRVLSALEKSGYPLELRIASALRKTDAQYVDQTRYYHDEVTNKVRETDVVACWQARRRKTYSFTYLVIECKSKPMPWVVFDSDESIADPTFLLESLFYWELYDEPRLRDFISKSGFNSSGTFLEPVKIGRSVVEPMHKSSEQDPAFAAVRAALSAANGFRKDVDDEYFHNLGKTSVVSMPTVVTSGSLFRGWLNGAGSIEIGRIDLACVAIRIDGDPQLKRCAVATEKGLSTLSSMASKTAKVLLG